MARHNSRLEEYREKERQQRDAVIAEFAAGDTEATLQAMAAEIRYRHLGHCSLPLPMDIAVL